jgi:hypothetical protein
MVNSYISKLSIRDNAKKMMIINISDKKTEKKNSEPIPIHHVQLIDRSGSMSSHINELIEDVKLTISHMRPQDFYTLIWFSGTGEYRTLLKGVPASADKEPTFRLLDSIKSTIGCTCFSESLNETKYIIEEMKNMCSNFSVTLFTDGAPVVPWGEHEEDNRVTEVLKYISKDIISFNTIGYGNYYNRDLLKKWPLESQFGEFTHASKISEYLSIFDTNYSRVSELNGNPIDISVKSPESNVEIYYITGSSVISSKTNCLHIAHSSKSKNQIVIFADNTECDKLRVSVNGQDFTEDNCKDSLNSWVESIFYKMAYHEYMAGNTEFSTDILGELKDKWLIDSQICSFTPDEIGKHIRTLRRAAFGSKGRNAGSCNKNYIPSDNTPCIIDLLRILVEDPKNKYNYSANKYERIGRKTEDKFNMFTEDSDNSGRSNMNDIVFNKERMNISIRFSISGYVKLNPKQASKVELKDRYPACIYRTHTIVKDGCLNMDELSCEVTARTYSRIKAAFPVPELIKSCNSSGYDMKYLVLDLKSIPIVNRHYCKISSKSLFNSVVEEAQLESYQKVINDYIKNNRVTNKSGIMYSNDLTEDQIQLLKEYGISDKGVYCGIDNKTESAKECDYYFSKSIKFWVKGFSSLPTVSKVGIDKHLILKQNEKFMAEEIDFLREHSWSDIEKQAFEIKARLSEVRATLCAVKIAKVLTGSWFDNLKDTKDPEVKEYTDRYNVMNKDEQFTINVKRSLAKSYFD